MALLNRKKTFLLGLISNYGYSIVSIIVGLLTVPIFLDYFGPIRYGIWVVVFSVSAYLEISGLGINSTTIVLIAKALKPYEQKIVLKRSFSVVFYSVIIVIFIILGVIIFYPNWISVIGKISIEFIEEAKKTVIVFSILFLLNMPFGVFYSGFVGMQKIHWERFYSMLTSIGGVIALFLTMIIKGNLVSMAWCRGSIVIAISITCMLHFILTNKEIFQKNIEVVNNEEFSSKSIFLTSMRFFSLTVVAIISWNINNFIISHFLGVDLVTPYAITFKLLNTCFVLFLAINSAIFPFWGKAVVFNQYEWIQDTYNNIMQLIPILSGGIWLSSIAFFKEIINLWVGPQGYGGFLVIFALGGYGFLLSLEIIHLNLLKGINAVKNTVFISWLELAVGIIISLLLVGSLGIGGVALGQFLGCLLVGTWMLPVAVAIKTDKKVKFDFMAVIIYTFKILIPFLLIIIFIYFFWKHRLSKILVNITLITLYFIISWNSIPVTLRKKVISVLLEYIG